MIDVKSDRFSFLQTKKPSGLILDPCPDFNALERERTGIHFCDLAVQLSRLTS